MDDCLDDSYVAALENRLVGRCVYDPRSLVKSLLPVSRWLFHSSYAPLDVMRKIHALCARSF